MPKGKINKEKLKEKAIMLYERGLVMELDKDTFQVASKSDPDNSHMVSLKDDEVEWCDGCMAYKMYRNCSHAEAVRYYKEMQDEN